MKRKVIIKFIIAIAILFGFLSISFCQYSASAEESTQKGGIKVEITDEHGVAVCGAKVFVCEISQCFETGKNGQTSNMALPILPDKRFLEICKKDFGEVTLLVTKDGYCPTCVTGVIVRGDVTRLGPKVTLKLGNENRHIADAIDASWLKRFCEKYSKATPVIVENTT